MFHDVSLLESAVELGRLITFYFDAGVGFVIFMGTLRSVLFRIISKYFPFLRGVSRSMQKSCYYAPVVILLRDTSSSSYYYSGPFSVSPYHAHYWVVIFQPITAATGALGYVPLLC